MLDFVFHPIRSSLRAFLGVAEHEAAETTPVQQTEEDLPAIADAIRSATKSIEEDLPAIAHAIKGATKSTEHNVEAIEQLASSVASTVDRLKDSVDGLNATMNDLVKILGPIAAAEHAVHDVERFFGRHRHQPDAADSHRD